MPTRQYLPTTRTLKILSTMNSAMTYLVLRTAVDEEIDDVGLTAQRSMEGECNEHGPHLDTKSTLSLYLMDSYFTPPLF
jgi:hypothetical protein